MHFIQILAYLFIYLFVLSTYLFIYLFYPNFYLFIYLFIRFIYLFIYSPIHLFHKLVMDGQTAMLLINVLKFFLSF